ncbi:MAG: cytochrome B [Betaproteobacteria bacterium]|nr:cytochrome B [Betaproteobacteria bacterium]NBY05514.1 cytochrome B [Betaproteobacteria bacterium]
MNDPFSNASRPTRVWDLPTRFFHWGLVACVAGLIVTGNMGGDMMIWHARFGFSVLALVFFRLAWGFVGGHWSRFQQFNLHPRHALTYVRNIRLGTHVFTAGHNPLGAWSVCLVLLLLLLQTASGLVADDEIAFSGPLSTWVSGSMVSMATWYHKAVGKKLLLLWIAMHLLAMVFHRWRLGENLVTAMFHGDKPTTDATIPSQDSAKTRWLALICLALSAALVIWLVNLPPAVPA